MSYFPCDRQTGTRSIKSDGKDDEFENNSRIICRYLNLLISQRIKNQIKNVQKILYLFVNVNCKQMIMICLCYYHTGVIITSEPITERLTHNHICVQKFTNRFNINILNGLWKIYFIYIALCMTWYHFPHFKAAI
jgi:hypothetical protein